MAACARRVAGLSRRTRQARTDGNVAGPRPKGPIIGIDQVLHFFFDDHDFDERDASFFLFSGELPSIRHVMSLLEVVHYSNRIGDNHYFLSHPTWVRVEKAAADAYQILAEKGLPGREADNA